MVRRAAAEVGLRATVYWGELLRRRRPRSGSAWPAWPATWSPTARFGSRTAALSAPYADRPDTCGHAYVTRRAGPRPRGRLHPRPGSRPASTASATPPWTRSREGFEAAERRARRRPALRPARHRLEHVEMPSPRHRRDAEPPAASSPACSRCSTPCGAARTGCTPPGWASGGGPPTRSGPWSGAGSALAFGSDSPVTPLGPWAAVRAAAYHHHDGQRLTDGPAFPAHTRGGGVRRARRRRRAPARRCAGRPGRLGRPRRPGRATACPT